MTIRKHKRALLALALGALSALPATGALAEDAIAEIRALKARLKQLEAKVAEQGKRSNLANAGVAPVCKDAHCPAPPPPVFVSFKNGLYVETLDHDFSFKIGGRIQVDGGVSSQPFLGTEGNAGIRRARLEVEGKAFKYWLYKLQYDFTGAGQAGIRDAYIALKHPVFAILPFTENPIVFLVGNSKEPQGLETITSNKYITFIERALVSDALTPSRHVGFSATATGKNWSAKGGVYSTSPEDRALRPLTGIPVPFGVAPAAGWVATGGGQYFDLTGRATYAPIMEKDQLVHLGGSIRYHRANDTTAATDPANLLLGAGTRSEANILGENLLGTTDLSCGAVPSWNGQVGAGLVAGKCVKDSVVYGAELAAAYGPFSIQAEYIGADYHRNPFALLWAQAALPGVFNPGGTSLHFDGYYAYASLFLTGESRASAYKVHELDGAAFHEVKIKEPFSKGGWGAWEVAARFSSLNLNSGPFSGSTYAHLVALTAGPARAAVANSSIVGGAQQDLTVGVNWYPDPGFRFMANWTRVMRLDAPWDRAYLNGAHPNLFVVRAQVFW
jgi:phosphate-selective porin OprO/OprP